MSAKERYLEAIEKDLRRKESSPVRPVEEKHRTVARNVLRKGMAISHALMMAGFSPAQASKGMHKVRLCYGLRTAFREEGEKIAREKEAAAKSMVLDPWAKREEMIVNLLEGNIKAKRDRAIGSAKLLGSHKKLNLWQPEFQNGVIILNVPDLPDRSAVVPEDE